jgi:hypothetical protein
MASASLPILTAILVALSLAPTPGRAQSYATDRGVVQISGTARITKFRDIGNDASTFVIDLNPRVGYFVLPGLLVAGNLEYAHFSQDNGSSSVYGVGPSLTYYLRHRTTKLNPYFSARTLYLHQTLDPDAGPSGSQNNFSWLGSVGVALFVARNVAIIGEAFYSHDHVTLDLGSGEQSNSSEEFGTQFGVAVHVF